MKQVFSMLALVCISAYTHAQFTLSGSVTGTDQEALIGAHITLNNTYYQTVTDSRGSFVFTGLKAGSYSVRASYIGYEPYTDTFEIKGDVRLSMKLKESPVVSDVVIVSAVRASQNTPTTFSMISKEDISRRNMAQDLPYLMSFEPSVVATSDAGAGVGYTGMRIRGSDITNINVTINGIPLNDPESHAVYWVDIPDFASSVNSVQLQRGVGSSTNGAGAFGASMNLETDLFQRNPFGEVSLSAGSFNTWKSSFQAGTGLLNNHWYFEGRASAIGSDGYIDRASSSLSSWFMQGGYYNDKTLVKFIVFGGKEKTYQAWYGTDEWTMNHYGRRFNWAGVIYNDDGSMSYYNNQTDNYTQNHYQLHISRRLNSALNLNVSGHYTRGSGYYEEYKQDQLFADYGLNNLYFGRDSILNGGQYSYFYHDSVTSTDLVRRRWLKNDYYGATWSLRYQKSKIDLTLGGAWNKFDHSRHFGEIIWAEYASQSRNDYEYYDNTGYKTDFNVFTKMVWSPVKALSLYGDIQYRTISYKVNGIESHLNALDISETYHFLNPKAGISYEMRPGTLYASYSIGHREPNRDDFVDAVAGEKPKPEMLGNLELGIRKTSPGYHYAVNYYLMNYVNQLVLTGEINDDGQYVRKNSGKSYRTGVEFSGGIKPATLFEVLGNLSLSINRTDYSQVNGDDDLITYRNKPISFSPSVVGSAQARVFPFRSFEFDWLLKYVGKQYLDNTGNKMLTLDPYLINDIRMSYLVSSNKMPPVEFTLMVNNLFNSEYESNGAVYDNIPYYYPQAGINFMAGINVKF